jgi:hypothetical protein
MREKLFLLAVKLLLYGYFAALSPRRYMASETEQLARGEFEGIWKEPAGGTLGKQQMCSVLLTDILARFRNDRL